MPRVCSFCFGVVDDTETDHPCESPATLRARAWEAQQIHSQFHAGDLRREFNVSTVAFPVWLQRAAYDHSSDSYELELQLDDGALVEASMTDDECEHVIEALTQLRKRRQQAASVIDVAARRSRRP